MTYDYLCTSCGHVWEAEQRISEDPLKQCPACNEMSAKRQISGGAGFILKGGGWYSDLYSSSQKSTKGSDKPAEKPSSCAAGACGTSACPAASSSSS